MEKILRQIGGVSIISSLLSVTTFIFSVGMVLFDYSTTEYIKLAFRSCFLSLVFFLVFIIVNIIADLTTN